LFDVYSEEIEFLLECTETNHEGNIEYAGFLSCFLDPSKEISFNLAVLVKKTLSNRP
jgi:ryanodine receptor 2